MLKIENNKFKFAFLLVAILSFFAIPIVVGLLKIGLFFSGFFLPESLILLKINMDEPISVSNYIYYYSCFSAIGVTGIFSYSIYKLSFNIDQRQLLESQKLKNLKFNNGVINILKELIQNEKAYSINRSPDDWSFKRILEESKFGSFDFGNATKEFSTELWSFYADDFILCVQESNEENSIVERLEKLNSTFKELKSCQDKFDIKMSYKDFTKLLSETINRLEGIKSKL